MKYLKFVILLLSFNTLFCILGGPPRTHLHVYNQRDELIFLISKRINIQDSHYSEISHEIEAKQKQFLNGRVGLHKPASKVYEYVIIKDSDNNILMDLRGETLNNAVTIDTDDKDHVIYRLDVY